MDNLLMRLVNIKDLMADRARVQAGLVFLLSDARFRLGIHLTMSCAN